MKRIFSLILVVAMVMGLSVQGFASADAPTLNAPLKLNDEFFDDKPYFIDMGDGNTYLGKFAVADLDESELDFWHHIMNCVSGTETSSKYIYVFAEFVNNAHSDFRIHLYETVNSGKANFVRYAWSPDVYMAVNSVPVKGTYASFKRLSFKFDNESGKFIRSSYSTSASCNVSLFTSNTCTFGGLLWTNDTSINSQHRGYSLDGNYTISSTYYKSAWDGSLVFVDDEFDEDTDPEEPDSGEDSDGDSENSGGADDGSDSSGGGSPEFPDSSTDNSDTTIELPKIDYDPTLVPYDLDAWDSIPKALMPQLKKVVSIAFPIVFIGMALEAFVLVVHHLLFAWLHKGGKGGGGVSSDE